MKVVPDESARARFLAGLAELDFTPWEWPMIEAAAETVAVIEGLAGIDDPPLAVTRELRLQRLALKQLLAAVRWPDHEQLTGSEWGRAMARRRWSRG